MKHYFCQPACLRVVTTAMVTIVQNLSGGKHSAALLSGINGRDHARNVHNRLHQGRIHVATPCYAARFPIYRA